MIPGHGQRGEVALTMSHVILPTPAPSSRYICIAKSHAEFVHCAAHYSASETHKMATELQIPKGCTAEKVLYALQCLPPNLNTQHTGEVASSNHTKMAVFGIGHCSAL